MSPLGSERRRRRLLVALLVVVIITTPGFEVVVGTGDSMEPRYQPCDLVLVDTVRDSVSAVHVHDTIAYRSESGLILHQVVGIALDEGYVLARGVNRETRDRVTSDMLVGVVIGHLDTSAVCSAVG